MLVQSQLSGIKPSSATIDCLEAVLGLFHALLMYHAVIMEYQWGRHSAACAATSVYLVVGGLKPAWNIGLVIVIG